MEKIEKIMDREIAWRIFAHEFNASNLSINEGDERAPNYIITPTGVKCNRLFIIGVITEVENIGKDNNLWRARIADPTGVFTLYAGQYQPEAAIFLAELEVPAYVALVGKARKYEPEDGNVYLSIRPEEINDADEKQRDMWVIETAERTLERIKIMEAALDSGLSGTQLQEFLVKLARNAALINGVALAMRHYKNLDRILPELKNSLVHAINTITSDSGIIHDHPPENLARKPVDTVQPVKHMEKPGEADSTEGLEESIDAKELKEEPPRPEPKEIIAGIIDQFDIGKGTSFSEVIEEAQKVGIDAAITESAIKYLMDEGRCYEPKIGTLRKV
jgi:RPA family protein